ncbi:MAG: hypothetical protein AAF846_23820 [Chloroflexota bacterium]
MVTNQIMPSTMNFRLKNHENIAYELDMLHGENGLLIAFTDDVWEVSSVRYVLWMQRYNFRLAARGINCAMIVPNQPYQLNGFYLSIPRDITIPLLADPNQEVYQTLGMEQSGYLLLDNKHEIMHRWYLNGNASISLKSIMYHMRYEG